MIARGWGGDGSANTNTRLSLVYLDLQLLLQSVLHLVDGVGEHGGLEQHDVFRGLVLGVRRHGLYRRERLHAAENAPPAPIQKSLGAQK